MQNTELLSYLLRGIDHLLAQDAFDGGQLLRRTQKQSLEAYKRYLENNSLSIDERLKGFFEIPTGIGKTAVFVGIVASAYSIAKSENKLLRSIIVVPSVQLLNQTQQSFIDFAPQTKKSIGLYGDGHKNYKQPITIMTYNAWYDLSQAGKINSLNVDILISDEAHRGTSERRVENILGIFNEKVAQIAFTATAHFDEEKSVQASHEREIFYKSISDGVREDELAAYIQSQRAVIRVAPTKFMLSDEFQEATKQEKTKYRQRIRQKAWNEFALKAYRDGHDEVTGDLLTDNQAGFFVEGIDQANKLEDLLNADPVLQERAREMGYKGVALAIHSRLSASEQRTRFEAYKNGEYMAVIGDEKFKEGFDHAPMKTIIDVPHASLVDKAQILGRGARKWWNEKKQRFEGMTIIDTVIYVGSNDTDIDKLIRDSALRNSIAVKDILEESFVISEAEKKRDKGGLGIGTAPNVFENDEDVEYYSKIEDVYNLESEISKLRREDYIEITDEMREDLISEINRTGIGSTKITQIEGCPDGLVASTIENWRIKVLQANGEHWNWVMSALREMPNAEIKIDITDEMRALLNSEMERTGLGSKRIIQLDGCPDDLNKSIIEKWMTSTSSANEKCWEWVIGALKTQPDCGIKINISDEMRNLLNSEFNRTGIGVRRLTNLDGCPTNLNIGTIESWRRDLLRANEEHWNWVMSALREMPNAEIKIDITDEMRELLNTEMERTAVGAVSIEKLPDSPNGLTSSTINQWKKGAKQANQSHWIWVISKLRDFPSVAKKIDITDEMRTELNEEINRTGAGATRISQLDNCPKDLNSGLIEGWRRDAQKVDPDHWTWVLSQLKGFPDAEKKIPITDEMRKDLISEMNRTGLGVTKITLLEGSPTGLSPSMIDSWRGTGRRATKFVNSKDWNWVMETLKKISISEEMVQITKEMHAHLISEMDRTNMKSTKITKLSDCPSGLRPNVIDNWRYVAGKGKTSTTKVIYWNWLVDTLDKLPTVGPEIQISENMREDLCKQIERTGIGTTNVVKHIVTNDLQINSRLVDAWKNGSTRTAREEVWNLVFNTYASLPDKSHKGASKVNPPTP